MKTFKQLISEANSPLFTVRNKAKSDYIFRGNNVFGNKEQAQEKAAGYNTAQNTKDFVVMKISDDRKSLEPINEAKSFRVTDGAGKSVKILAHDENEAARLAMESGAFVNNENGTYHCWLQNVMGGQYAFNIGKNVNQSPEKVLVIKKEK